MVHRVKHCKVKSIYIKIYPLSLERQAQLFLCATCIIFCLLTNDEMKMTMHNIKHASVSCLWWIPHTRTYVRIRKGTMSTYVFVLSLGFSMRYP
jgi:hypothetical protein